MATGWLPVVIGATWVAVTPPQLLHDTDPLLKARSTPSAVHRKTVKQEVLSPACGLHSGNEFVFSLSCATSSGVRLSSNP